jgi:sialate O-acetylesterase
MNPSRLIVSLLLVLVAAPAALLADITPAPLFTDHAVLQRDKPVPVWGRADASEKVTVTFAGQTKSVTTGPDGRWRVTLDPMPARSEPAVLTLAGKNTITLQDVVVGEVWLASGQSNMEWPVNRAYGQEVDVPGSTNRLIRHIKIRRTVADAPADEVAIERGTWEAASPGTTGNFSAVGYYFARDLQATLGVPIGIIGSNWGGTRAEAWTDSETLAATDFDYVREAWSNTLANFPTAKSKFDAAQAEWTAERDAAKARNQRFTKRAPQPPPGPGHQATPSGLYNGMIAPLVPYAIRGAIWYQGEGNAAVHAKYHQLFSAMITGWRARFGQGDFAFYWVQLANFAAGNQPDGTDWAFLREAQTKTRALPNTGQAVIVDIGNVRDIHPRNKVEVGRRLARLALNRDYGLKMEDSGPVFAKAERDGTGFRVSFTQIGGGLIAPLNELSGFELAGVDQVFHPARAEIVDDAVVVNSAKVPDPVAVRYAWRNAPVAGLFNLEGLPAVPFRTDTW